MGTDVIRIANNWRLFFQVTTLSDVVTADGLRIQSRYWKQGRHTTTISSAQTTRLNWPVQQRPDSTHFGKWISCLKEAFGIDTQEGILPQCHQLGDWTVLHNELSNQWDFYFDIDTQCLYQTQDPQWLKHPIQQTQTRASAHMWSFSNLPDDITDYLPPYAFPVTVIRRPNVLIVQHRQFRGPTRLHQPATNTFEDYILQLPKWRSDILMHWSSVPVPQLIRLLAQNTTLYLASDGAFSEENMTGAYGVVIATNVEELMTGQGSAPGALHLHSSFRSELYGLLAGCLLLAEIIKYYNLPVQQNQQLKIYIDNKGVVDRVNKHRRTPVTLREMLDTDIDIELQILHELQDLTTIGLQIVPLTHVKAHQDRHKQLSDLSREAQLNVQADHLAAQVHTDQLITIPYSVPEAVHATLFINDIPITSKYRENLRDAYNSQHLRTYMQEKYQWCDQVIDDIWWEGHNRALKKLSHADRLTIQKYNFHHLPTLRREKLKHTTTSDFCPHCHINEQETDDHILLCTSPPRMEAKKHWERIIYDYLSKEFTPFAVKQAIMLAIHNWLLLQPIPNIDTTLPHLHPDVKTAYKAQSAIGWDQLIRGRCSHLWRPIIQNHLRIHKIPGSTMSSNNWVAGLILTCWNGVLSLWDVRNKEYHGHDDASQQAAAQRRLLLEAIPLLQHADKVHPTDRHWFSQTVETLTALSVISLQAWIRNARTMVRIHHRDQLLDIAITPSPEDDMETTETTLQAPGEEGNNTRETTVEETIDRRGVVS